MNWLFFALLAPAIYAIVVFVDKYILEKEIRDYRGIPIYSALAAFVFGILLWVITGFPILGFRDAVLIIFTGMLTIFGLATYFKVLSSDEASKVTILFQMTPVIILIMAYLFLKETIGFNQLLGFLLILFATLGISVDKKGLAWNLSSSFFLILLTDFLWASAYVLFKFVVNANSFTKVISFESFGMAFGGLFLYIFFPSIKKSFLKTKKKIKKKVFGFIFINESIFVASRLCTYLAISLGPVALVEVVAGTQVFFAIFYGVILTLIAPKIFKENISKEGLIRKIMMGIFVLLGLYLVR